MAKHESGEKENLVDRRVINQFLVQYLNHKGSREVQMQMLVAMSSLLNFSLEEKEMLGLVEKKGAERKNSDVNIGAKLINFLMEDDE